MKTMQTLVTSEKSDSEFGVSKLQNLLTAAREWNKTQTPAGFDSGSVTNSVTLCTMCLCCYWRHSKAGRQFLLPWKRNLEAVLKRKMTWFVHYHVEPQISMLSVTTSRLSLCIDCKARCVIECCFKCFYFCSVHVQQMSHWRSCTVGEPRTFSLFINWATCLKTLRTLA